MPDIVLIVLYNSNLILHLTLIMHIEIKNYCYLHFKDKQFDPLGY